MKKYRNFSLFIIFIPAPDFPHFYYIYVGWKSGVTFVHRLESLLSWPLNKALLSLDGSAEDRYSFDEAHNTREQWSCKRSSDIWAYNKHKTYKTWIKLAEQTLTLNTHNPSLLIQFTMLPKF